MPALLIKASFFGFYEIARVFKVRINSYLNGPSSVKEVAGLKKQAEIYPAKAAFSVPIVLLKTGQQTSGER